MSINNQKIYPGFATLITRRKTKNETMFIHETQMKDLEKISSKFLNYEYVKAESLYKCTSLKRV